MLDFAAVHALPWHILFLLGGGYAISVAWRESGVSTTLADAVLALGSARDDDGAAAADASANATAASGGARDDASGGGGGGGGALVVGAVACALAVALSNIVSNIAVANMLLGPLGCVAVRLGVHPLALMAPTCFACSLAFLFPVGTPPNAIAFATGDVAAAEMRAAGAWLTLLVAAVLVAACWLMLPAWVAASDHGAAAGETPAWARDAC